MADKNSGWHEEARIDRETLGLGDTDILAELRKRRIIVRDMQGRKVMNVSLIGGLFISIAVPVLPAIVALLILLGKRTVAIVRSEDIPEPA
jgi:hypothetical protein